MIGGFIISSGSSPKQILVRTVGPSTGVPGALVDPILELHEPDGTVVTNDNWQDASNASAIPAALQPKDAREPAILVTLPSGAYTGVVRGKLGTTGIALVEVYDLSGGAAPKIVNISTRGFVQTGDNTLIGGFIIGSNGNATMDMIVRGLGPSLTEAGVGNALADPFLDVRDKNGNTVLANDNWKTDSNASKVSQSGIAPRSDMESALYLSLPPGEYTVILSGSGGTSGVGLVEVYAVTSDFNVTSQPEAP